MKTKLFLFIICLTLQGCPLRGNDDLECEKVTVCQDDRESYCDLSEEGSCIKTCHYFVHEFCWEECEEDHEDR